MGRADFVLTEDVRPEWGETLAQLLDVVRRIQSVAKSRGCSIITISVLCDARGVPWLWTEPKVTKLEPGAACEVDKVVAGLDGSDVEKLLKKLGE